MKMIANKKGISRRMFLGDRLMEQHMRELEREQLALRKTTGEQENTYNQGV